MLLEAVITCFPTTNGHVDLPEITEATCSTIAELGSMYNFMAKILKKLDCFSFTKKNFLVLNYKLIETMVIKLTPGFLVPVLRFEGKS